MYIAVGAGLVAAAVAIRRSRSDSQEANDAALAVALQEEEDAALAASMQSVDLDAASLRMQRHTDGIDETPIGDIKAMLTALGIEYSDTSGKAQLVQLLRSRESSAPPVLSGSRRKPVAVQQQATPAPAPAAPAAPAASAAPAAPAAPAAASTHARGAERSAGASSYIPNALQPVQQRRQAAQGGPSSGAGHVIVLKRGTPQRPHYVPLCQYDTTQKRIGLGCWEVQHVPPAVASLWQRSHAAALGVGGCWAELSADYSAPTTGNALSPFTQARGFKFPRVDEDGDCFYSSVRLALSTIGCEVTIESLRKVVAEKLTPMHLEVAQVKPVADLKGHLGSMGDYRARVAQLGGAWADDFAASTVRDHLGLAAILIIDIQAPTRDGKYERLRI